MADIVLNVDIRDRKPMRMRLRSVAGGKRGIGGRLELSVAAAEQNEVHVRREHFLKRGQLDVHAFLIGQSCYAGEERRACNTGQRADWRRGRIGRGRAWCVGSDRR